jgi:transglutaminase-like putative cysteine protease
MREANWDEIFQRRSEDAQPDERIASFLPWEDWLTLIIVGIGFMAVVHSIDSADWVDGLPSLYPIGFAGLLMGYGLSKLRIPEALIHPPALLAGATLVFLQVVSTLPGGSIAVRTDAMVDRMHAWWSAVTLGGISSDPLPFITFLVVLTWTGAYVSSWAVFRWRNPWVALIPGGTALLWNVSFIPGQFSNSFIVFLFAAVLLVMRVHISEKERDWERRGIRYPEFLSLSALHWTFWLTVILVVLVRALPLASRSDTAYERWHDFTAPISDRFTPLARVFVSVDAKRPVDVHNLNDALAFQGKIKLSNREALDVTVELTPELAAYLRAQSFDEYTASGWKVNIEGDVPVRPGQPAGDPTPDEEGRQDITVNVTVKGNNDDFLYSIGQPVRTDRGSEAGVGGTRDDVTRLRPRGRLGEGDTYTVTGSVSVASVEQLRAAGTDYPGWVEERYLALPSSLPDRVTRKAQEVARNATTPYDQAAAVERYLRTFPIDYNVSSTPPGRDSVDYFLFDLQRGYFDYHASAMAVMLRSLGVPARVAAGYVVDPLARQGDSNTFGLTERYAFAWPEVYFPGLGWVEFNPTPSQPAIQRAGQQPDAPAADPRDATDDPGDANPFDLGIEPPASDQPAAAEDQATGGSSWPLILAVAIAGGIVAVIALGARFAWEAGLSSLSPAGRAWEKTLRLARWGRLPQRVSETPREFAARVRTEEPPAAAVGYLAAQYERQRFGQKDLSDEDAERLESAWTAARNALLRRALRLRRRDEP